MGRSLVSYVKKLVEQHGEQKGKLTSEVLEIIRTTEDASQLADLLATQLITDDPRASGDAGRVRSGGRVWSAWRSG